MSELNTTISLSEDDLETLSGLVEECLERLTDAITDRPDITNPEMIFGSDHKWSSNPNYVRAWVQFDDLGGVSLELPAGSVSWHSDIRWERHEDGRCWEVEPRRLSERRMKELEKKFLDQRGERVLAAVSK